MPIPLVAANWKMHKTIVEAVAYVRDLSSLVRGVDDVQVVVAPPFIALRAVADAAAGTRIGVAGQDVHHEREGAFTGEVSVAMLLDGGARLVIIGHSERRTQFGETDAAVNAKVGAALAGGLVPIVCVGETLGQREAGETMSVLDRQVSVGLKGVSAEAVGGLAIAYEPVWAIGTGRTASAAQAQEAHAHIRGRLRESFGASAAERCRVIYGGSVKPANAAELVGQPDVDGALVGGASLDPLAFSQIVSASRRGGV